MVKVNSSHCRIVRDSLAGERAVDGQTFVSLAVLEERLERLRRLDEAFCDVEFSSAVEKLKNRQPHLPVG
jgi:hypothetical protein